MIVETKIQEDLGNAEVKEEKVKGQKKAADHKDILSILGGANKRKIDLGDDDLYASSKE